MSKNPLINYPVVYSIYGHKIGLMHLKAHITLEMRFALATQRESNLHKKKGNVHGQRQNFALGTQRNLYSTVLHLGFASGETQILGLALGVTQILWLQDTNMLVSPTQNSGVGGIAQHQTPTPGILRHSGI